MSRVSDFEIIQDNRDQAKQQLSKAVKRALIAAGQNLVDLIQGNMDTKYGRPIWKTGDLHRDVQYQLHDEQGMVYIGNTLEYAPFVHEGTCRMAKRPYIRDTMMDSRVQQAIKEVIEENLD